MAVGNPFVNVDAKFVVTLRAKATQTVVTIRVTFYRHVRGFNEPAVDPSEGIKTRGPRTNYGAV